MAAIQRFLRVRKLQRLGKFLLLVTVLLACWRYVLNLPLKQMSVKDKTEVVKYNLTIANHTPTATSSTTTASSALKVYFWRGVCG